MKPDLILASTSASRRTLLENAGLRFQCVSPEIDERKLGDPLESAGAGSDLVAQALAEAKALDVSNRYRDAFVIGADQTMALGTETFHKPKGLDDAKHHLTRLGGRTHTLYSAVCIAVNGVAIWNHVSPARLTMRPLTEDSIDTYLARAGDAVLWSVGAYQLEGLGVTLFEKIDGDFFTILGLPMLPLLSKLRELGVVNE